MWRAHPQEAWVLRAKANATAEPANARHWDVLGDAHLGAGEWQEAIDAYNIRDRIGGSPWQWFPLAVAHQQLGHRDEARAWFHKAIDWMDDRQEMRLRRKQAEAAVALGLPDTWARSQKASNHIKMGDAFRKQGEKDKAAMEYSQAISLYESLVKDIPAIPAYQRRLAILLARAGRHQAAEAAYREALAARRAMVGEVHFDVADLLHSLSFLQRDQGKLSEAEATARESLAMRRKLFGDEHLHVAHSLHMQAWNVHLQGRHSEAETLSREEIAIWRKVSGNEHPDVAWGLSDLAVILRDQGKHAEAEAAAREALAIRRKQLPQGDSRITESSKQLNKLLQAQGKPVDVLK